MAAINGPPSSGAGFGADRSQKAGGRLAEQEVTRFGIFELDLRRKELRRKGVKVPLQQQPFDILRLLVAHAGDFVGRELIQETLWPDGRFVDFERSINTAMMKLRQALRESASSPAYIETVPRSGYRLIAPVMDAAEPKPAITAIAILPLQDLSALSEGPYFVDGLTDALVTEMARRSRLRVVSRMSMSRYKDTQLSVRQIAEELNVQAIVEGSILRSNSRIRISARLLDAIEDRHLWAQTYDRNLEDILSLHQEIATDIVSSAARALEDEPAVTPARHVDPRAYDSFLKGNFFLSLRSPKSWTKAIECFESALSLEPEWAEPHAALAEVHRLVNINKLTSSDAIHPQIVTLSERALQLDSGCALAHATLGAFAALHRWQWGVGQQRIEKALRLDPQSSHVEQVLATVLLNRRQYEQALEHIDAALSIDPSSFFLRSYRIQILVFARRFEEALRDSEELYEGHVDSALGLMQYGCALTCLNRPAEGLSLLQRAYANVPFPLTKVGIAYSQWMMGRRDDAAGTVDEVLQMHRGGASCSPTFVSLAFAVLGDCEKSIQWLQKAFSERDTTLPLTIQLPPGDAIRADDRVTRILEQVYAG